MFTDVDSIIIHRNYVKNWKASMFNPMNTFYLVRHGENRANITKEFSYKLVDYSLTAKGVLQAEQAAVYFNDKNIHAIYSSPLKRAKETADVIAQHLQLPVITMEQFREVNVGNLEGQPTNKENWAIHDQIIADWFSGKHDSTFPGGENYTMLLRRMNDGLRKIMIDNPDSSIIVVAHGGIITSSIRDICTNVDQATFLESENANCSITEMKAQLDDGRISGELIMWAYHGHLHGEAAKLVAGHPDFE